MEIWETGGHPKLYEVTVRSTKPQKIVIGLEDCCKPNTFYTRQEVDINAGVDRFELSLPLTPTKAFFDVKPAGKIVYPWSGLFSDPTLTYQVVEKPFAPKWNCIEISRNEKLKSFLRFASYLSQNAGVLYAAHNDEKAVYRSADRQFVVRYVPEIIDDELYLYNDNGEKKMNANYGLPIPTSFRVEINTKEMELAQKFVLGYSVAQRFVLFVHEYAHGYLSADPDNEFEADDWSIRICRCLGFTKYEIADAYAMVFLRYWSDENVERMNAILNTLKQIP